MKKISFIFILFLTITYSCTKDKQLPLAALENAGIVTPQSYNISYYDWAPDSSLYTPLNGVGTDSIEIDLDLDSVFDVKLKTSTKDVGFGGGSGGPNYAENMSVVSLNSNVSIASGTLLPPSFSPNFINIMPNDSINESLHWGSGFAFSSFYPPTFASGFWFDLTHSEYIAVKIASSNGVKYGWVNVEMPYVGLLIMKGQALNNNYNQPILVGQTN
jgi:hypothetical protein